MHLIKMEVQEGKVAQIIASTIGTSDYGSRSLPHRLRKAIVTDLLPNSDELTIEDIGGTY
jgi:hypothetical protein